MALGGNQAQTGVHEKYGLTRQYTMTQGQVYLVTFRVQKKIQDGEVMAVLGNTDSLGHWKQPLYFLKWTEGDVWVSEKPLVVKNTHHFNYKYAMIEGRNKIVGWERGVDRIADLVIMPESNFQDVQANMLSNKYSHANIKNIEYKDQWE